MTLLTSTLTLAPPSDTLRGRNGVIRRIKQRVPKFQKHDKTFWATVFQDILDNWET